MFHHEDLVLNANRGLAKNSLAKLLKLSANRTRHQRRRAARLTIGRTQQRARCPMAAQTEPKLAAETGTLGAVDVVSHHGNCGAGFESLTRTAVQIGNTEDVGGAALGGVVEAGAGVVGSRGSAAAAAAGGDGEGDAGEEGGDDGGDLHFDGWW